MDTEDKRVLYCLLMEDIKARVALIKSFLQGQSLGREDFNGEVVSLQLRKCLEIVVYSSLIVNERLYAKTYADFAKHWRIAKIVGQIRKLNSNFFPQPIFLSSKAENGVVHFDFVKDGFLTLEELIVLYDKTSQVIHTWNPCRTDPRIVDFGRTIEEWVQRLVNLLNFHIVHGVGLHEFWIVKMLAAEDGKVHVISTEPIPK